MIILEEQINEVWEDLVRNKMITPQLKPQGFVLGGQPGAGKSSLIEKIWNKLSKNAIIINGDDFRKFHPKYEVFQKEYAKDSPKYTADFAGKMTEAILDRVIKEKYNVIIEGTFRTSETPIKTLAFFKKNGYQTNVFIQTCPKEISWKSCMERYKKMSKACLQEARYTDKTHHDLVIKNLARNAELVYKSGLVDYLEIHSREKELYNSKTNPNFNSHIIEQELNRLNKNGSMIVTKSI